MLTAIRKPHVLEARCHQRLAAFMRQRIGPRFAVSERLSSSAECAVEQRASGRGVLLALTANDTRQALLGRAAANYAASGVLPFLTRVSEDADRDAIARVNNLRSEKAALKVRKMAMPCRDHLQRGLNRAGCYDVRHLVGLTVCGLEADKHDTFVSGLGAIEKIAGNNFRFHLFVDQEADDGTRERVCVAKIIVPAACIPDTVIQMLTALGIETANLVPRVAALLN